MRPLALRLSGFRSYRSERTVSFRDLDLVAIIGDTGAGKSSLLEAMTWALYGASTWSRKSSTDLLGHGSKRMSVALDFEAGGEEWRVLRTFARSGGGGAELECLSNPVIAKIDGVRQVDPAVEELLGLSYDVFCSCVLLPQGKFERLLKATPGTRTDTLKSILRLEQLSETRDLADRHAGLVAEREREMLAARGRFREDPAADVAAAEVRLERLQPEFARLETLTAHARELLERCRSLAERAKEATESAERVERRRGDGVDVLRSLVARGEKLDEELAQARRASELAADLTAQLEERQVAAQRDGLDVAMLMRHEGTVETIRSTHARREALAGRVTALERESRAANEALDAARRALGPAEAAMDELEERERRARELTGGAEAKLTAAQAAASALEAATDAEAAAAAALGGARDAIVEYETSHRGLVDRLAQATAARDGATSARETAYREQAAAHAAAGYAEGDPCPICSRELPADFTPPSAPALDAAIEAFDAADSALTAIARQERAAAMELRAAIHRAAAADETLSVAREARESAERSQLPVDEAAGAVADARRALDDLTAAREAKVEALAECRAAEVRAETQASGCDKAVAERREELDGIAAELETAVLTLPEYCAIEPGALGSGTLEAVAGAVAERLEAARRLQREREAAATGAAVASNELARLELALQKEVVTPAATIRAALVSLHAELPPAATEELPLPPPEAGPASLLAFAVAVDARAETHLAELRSSAADALVAREHDDEEGRRLVKDAGFDDSRALATRFDAVRGLVFAAENERKYAVAHIEGAARLDELLGRARELRAGFEALKDALADRAFVGYVVSRRQRALLVHASKVLDDITGRYAFTDDFRILDRESGLPRSPDTLSGGETFIASLALALGLVEVADRSGGDLRALFLDEGFGTLDAAILETAISALEERAKSGRLIGVISHVPTVAERIDTVLEVRHGLDGSTVEILSADEREQRVTDGVEAAAVAV